MPEQIEHRSPNWYKESEITVGVVIIRGEKYITPDDVVYFPDNVCDAIALLAYYIDQAGDDPELVLEQMGLLKALRKTE